MGRFLSFNGQAECTNQKCSEVLGDDAELLRLTRISIREGKETAILTKSIFCISEFFGRSLVLPWFLLGLLPEGNREGTKVGNLNKTPFVHETQMAF